MLQNSEIIILIFKEIFMPTMTIKTPKKAIPQESFSAIMRTSEVIRAISKDFDANVTAFVTNSDEKNPTSPLVVTFIFDGDKAIEATNKMNIFVKQYPNLSGSYIAPPESTTTHADRATKNRMIKMDLERLSKISPEQFEVIVKNALNFKENQHGKNEGMMAL